MNMGLDSLAENAWSMAAMEKRSCCARLRLTPPGRSTTLSSRASGARAMKLHDRATPATRKAA
jgi:hypothetical protein